MSYNLWLKRTVLSFLPYLISFGAMPWAIYCANSKIPPLWLYSAFAIFTIAFHFVNVIKDMESDRDQLIMGLPQRLGTKLSAVIAAILFVCGIIDVLLR
jgi:4-hydroxybenzoate polyprenyltransferase